MRPGLAACAMVHCPPSLTTSLPPFTPAPTHARTRFASRTRERNAQGHRPLICAGGTERYAPHLLPLFSLPHAQDVRMESVGAPPPRLHRGRGKVPPPFLPLLQPHMRRQDARTGRAAPLHSPAALICAQRAHGTAPPFAPSPPLARERVARMNTQGPPRLR